MRTTEEKIKCCAPSHRCWGCELIDDCPWRRALIEEEEEEE